MNIGIYLSSAKPTSGGSFTFEDTVLQALLNCQTHHNLYIFWHGPSKQTQHPNISLVNIGNNNPKGFQKLKREALRLFYQLKGTSHSHPVFANALKMHKIDLVWFPSPTFEDVGTLPYIFTVWDLNHRIHPYFPEIAATWNARESFYNKVIPKASYIITGTETGKEEISHFYRTLPEHIKIIPFPTPNLSSITPLPISELQKKFNIRFPYLYYPSIIWSHKNHYCILEALRILKETYNETYYLIITGRDAGNLEYLKRKTDEMNLHNQVSFLGFVDSSTKVALYKNAHALVYASYFGPDNLPPLEAFSLECPAICGRYHGAEEQLKNNALYFDLSNSHELAEQILALNNNPALKTTLLAKALAFSKTNSPDSYITSTLAIIDEFQAIRNCWGKNYKEL